MWDNLARPTPEQASYFRSQGWWRDETFADDLVGAAARTPDKPAVIAYREGSPQPQVLSYAELAAVTRRVTAGLVELGVGPGDVVAVHLPNWWMIHPLFLACGRLGAVVAPVIPAFGVRELGYVLQASLASVCVVPDSYQGVDYAARLARAAPATLRHQVVARGRPDADTSQGAIDFDEFFLRTAWEQRHPVDRLPRPDPDSVALLLFTSGTTGAPKGVAHSHNTLAAATRGMSDPYALTGSDVVSIPHYLTHIAGAGYAVLMVVALGATCVMQDDGDMGLLLDLVERHKITFVYAAPMFVTQMVAAQRQRTRDLSSLANILSGSAPIPPRLIAEAGEVLGVRMGALWGMTETGAATITRPDDPPGWAAHSDGRAVPWMQVHIDKRPEEKLGRLLVRGASLCLGYVNQPEAFAASRSDDGWFDTGDLARDDTRGGIRITGRRADLITRANAAKVPTLEVEGLLSRHPLVREIVLIGYPDPQFDGAELVCAVVVAGDRPPTVEDLTGFLDEEGVTQENWPDRIRVVDSLPKNSLGKVERAPLRELVATSATPDP